MGRPFDPYHAPMATSFEQSRSRTGPTGHSAPGDPQQAVRDAGTMGPGFGPGSARELMPAETFTGRPSVRGRQHMISAVHYLATMGGLQVLERGGNAIDAGVAAGLCINVVQPQLAM